jgi:hypothetical protein
MPRDAARMRATGLTIPRASAQTIGYPTGASSQSYMKNRLVSATATTSCAVDEIFIQIAGFSVQPGVNEVFDSAGKRGFLAVPRENPSQAAARKA